MTLDASNRPVAKGVENLIEIVSQALHQEAPIRVSESVELAFFDKSVWRGPTDSTVSISRCASPFPSPLRLNTPYRGPLSVYAR